MANSLPQTTARIYQFPTRRSGEVPHAARGSGADRAAPAYPAVEFGSGWYHQAAIAESEKPRKA